MIGAGIAGAALARALSRQGCAVTVLDQAEPGAGASGNAAALVTPRLDAGDGPAARLHALAFARAAALYADETPGAVIATGALQLHRTERDAARFTTISAFDGFDPATLQPLTAPDVAARIGEAEAPGGLHLHEACVVEPLAVLSVWLVGATVTPASVAALERSAEGDWRLLDDAGECIAQADAVVVAVGAAARRLLPTLALRPVRGQVSTAATPFDGAPAAWGGYAIPTREGVLFGASHGPGDAGDDIRTQDAAANLERLKQGRPGLAARVAAPEPGPTRRAGRRAHRPSRPPACCGRSARIGGALRVGRARRAGLHPRPGPGRACGGPDRRVAVASAPGAAGGRIARSQGGAGTGDGGRRSACSRLPSLSSAASPPMARALLKPLSEQVVVITGATSGIGLATAAAGRPAGRRRLPHRPQRRGASPTGRGAEGQGRPRRDRHRRRGRRRADARGGGQGGGGLRRLRHLGEQCRRLDLRPHRGHAHRGPAPPVRHQLLGAW